MDQVAAAREPDPLLAPYLQAREAGEVDRRLAQLLQQHAEPIVQGVIRRKLHVSPGRLRGGTQSQDDQDAEDVHGEAVAQLLARLRKMKEQPGEEAISDFRGYVAVTAYRVCDLYLRRKYPQRTSLKNRVRYLLEGRTNQVGFALWQNQRGEWMCGFDAWRKETKTPARNTRCQQLLSDPFGFAQAELPKEDPRRMNPAALLAALFNAVGQPIELDDLVGVLARLWEIREPAPVAEIGEEEGREAAWERVADPAADVGRQVEQREYLRRLWAEIRELPARQAAALLLNLRDPQGRGIIALLPIAGIATIRQIAEALGLPASEFAFLWNDLPLDDASIAQRLGITRQQVINLRKVARERLGRRMRAAFE